MRKKKRHVRNWGKDLFFGGGTPLLLKPVLEVAEFFSTTPQLTSHVLSVPERRRARGHTLSQRWDTALPAIYLGVLSRVVRPVGSAGFTLLLDPVGACRIQVMLR
jgi:hypothetical protein